MDRAEVAHPRETLTWFVSRPHEHNLIAAHLPKINLDAIRALARRIHHLSKELSAKTGSWVPKSTSMEIAQARLIQHTQLYSKASFATKLIEFFLQTGSAYGNIFIRFTLEKAGWIKSRLHFESKFFLYSHGSGIRTKIMTLNNALPL